MKGCAGCLVYVFGVVVLSFAVLLLVLLYVVAH